MGRRGPRPKPTALRVLKGNPTKRPLPEHEAKPPVPASLPDPPARLDEVGAAGGRSASGPSPRTVRGQLLGRPSWRDGYSEYLLPGFAECALCSGSIRTVTEKRGRPGRRVVARKYGCATNQSRGDAACANRTRLC